MEIKITDGTSFENTEKQRVSLFSYYRKYTTTKWVSTILPVAFDYSDWSSKFEVAEITGVTATTEDGVLISFTYEKTILTEGSKTKPNHPYLIRAKKASSSYQILKKANCDVFPTNAIDNIELVSEDFKFIISGTYENIEYPDFDYYFGGEIWKPATASSKVGPFRSFVCIDVVLPEEETVVEGIPAIGYQDLVKGGSQVIGKLTIGDQTLEIKIPTTAAVGGVSYQNLVSGKTVTIGKLTIGGQEIEIKIPDLESRIEDLERRLGNMSF